MTKWAKLIAKAIHEGNEVIDNDVEQKGHKENTYHTKAINSKPVVV